jgi:hypothetical protein
MIEQFGRFVYAMLAGRSFLRETCVVDARRQFSLRAPASNREIEA